MTDTSLLPRREFRGSGDARLDVYGAPQDLEISVLCFGYGSGALKNARDELSQPPAFELAFETSHDCANWRVLAEKTLYGPRRGDVPEVTSIPAYGVDRHVRVRWVARSAMAHEPAVFEAEISAKAV